MCSSSSKLPLMRYASRLKYTTLFRAKRLTDFLVATPDSVRVMAHTFIHRDSGVRVTLIPLIHVAHPQFFQQVDMLCCQHDSVLMEGRAPNTLAPHSTLVPPRKMSTAIRPVEHIDDEGWEPMEVTEFWQPFSWGVADSPNYTVIHAADKYDYEKLPVWASMRFSMPLLGGGFNREIHCLDMVPPLVENGYKSFAVPWGAAHMPILAQMLLHSGFEEIGQTSLTVFNSVDGLQSEGWVRRFAKVNSHRDYSETIGAFAFCALMGYWLYLGLLGFQWLEEEDKEYSD